MQLRCPVLLDDQQIPVQYTCDSDNISPPLTWQDPPAGTQSYALIVEDPDAPSKIFTHWLIYNVPGDAQHLPAAIARQAQLNTGAMQGKNDFGDLGWGGPCPPKGTHRYMFQLYALDQSLALSPGATKAELLQQIQGHILDRADLTGRYTRSPE